MFTKVLIANRGEIALRVIRACRELNIRTVAVYSEADRESLHVKMADEAVCIGAPKSAFSYLNINALISAAQITDADAIHPGYGFLSENAHFAEVCASCGIKFIGPTPESMRSMGDKISARRIMKKHNVPVVEGTVDPLKDKEEARAIAKKIGYPVIIKATAGGGGRGMRVCHTEAALLVNFGMAQAEAEACFSNGALYMEKYIQRPRHIEIQIAADEHGNVIHLGERDCTIQRRHQKLIEEAPSPVVDEKLRKKIGEYAIKAAKAIDYHNVGTIEFLMDMVTKEVFFCEMNTRVQVEHPVTEVVTDIDILKLQLQIAQGIKLPFKQEDIKISGHAFEIRINAEDPDNNFAPCPGKIAFVHFPGGWGVRVDSHIYSGYSIPPYYDSLIGKLVVRGHNRAEAIKTVKRCLDEMVIDPIKTTIPFARRIMDDDDFRAGQYDTSYLNKFLVQAPVEKGA